MSANAKEQDGKRRGKGGKKKGMHTGVKGRNGTGRGLTKNDNIPSKHWHYYNKSLPVLHPVTSTNLSGQNQNPTTIAHTPILDE